MDKNKLLNNLKARRDAWNESLINTMKENIKSEASLKILNDIIAEIEDAEEEKKPDFLSLDDIVKGMKDYCELFNGRCKDCYFLLDETHCMMKLISMRVERTANCGSTKE